MLSLTACRIVLGRGRRYVYIFGDTSQTRHPRARRQGNVTSPSLAGIRDALVDQEWHWLEEEKSHIHRHVLRTTGVTWKVEPVIFRVSSAPSSGHAIIGAHRAAQPIGVGIPAAAAPPFAWASKGGSHLPHYDSPKPYLGVGLDVTGPVWLSWLTVL